MHFLFPRLPKVGPFGLTVFGDPALFAAHCTNGEDGTKWRNMGRDGTNGEDGTKWRDMGRDGTNGEGWH